MRNSFETGNEAHEYATTIKQQWGKMGLSVDYFKVERFTLDEGLSKAVRKVFVELLQEGMDLPCRIYLSTGIQKARTALSDVEVGHKDVEGASTT